MGSIEPFLQIGGDISAKEGWRIAVSLIYQQTQDKRKNRGLTAFLGGITEPCIYGVTLKLKKPNNYYL